MTVDDATVRQTMDERAGVVERMLAAEGCNDCFLSDPTLHRPVLDAPQARWIGRKYFSSSPRIALVLVNPGGGNSDGAFFRREATIFRDFFTTRNYGLIEGHFVKELKRGVKWLAWYRDVLGLNHDEIAQLNVAWCGTKENRYPPKMLDHCFRKHTSGLLRLLDPQVVLLSGSAIHRFSSPLSTMLPSATIISTLHYANRKSRADEHAEARRVWSIIRGIH